MKILSVIVLVLLILSCGDSKNYVETKYDLEIEQYLDDKKWDVNRTESGLYIYVESEGTIEKPKLTDYVTIKYTSYLLNGAVFDETHGSTVTFPVPVSELIEGWTEGLSHFGKGGKGKLIIPPSLAFGNKTSGLIPANSVIVIDLEVINFNTKTKKVETNVISARYSEVIEQYIEDHDITDAIKTKEGIYVIIDKEGSENKPTINNKISIKYKGYLMDNTIFDQTEDETRTFELNRLIQGWKIGIPYIGVGGKCKLIIPPSLGYGSQSTDVIPSNSILIFDIELESFL